VWEKRDALCKGEKTAAAQQKSPGKGGRGAAPVTAGAGGRRRREICFAAFLRNFYDRPTPSA